MPILRLVRGVSGSGKSTFAKTFGCFHLEADMFHVRDGEYKWKGERVREAHAWCQRMTMDAMSSGMDVVVSNTFTTKKELQPYLYIANNPSYNRKLEIYKCTGNYGNIHDVPEESIKKMKDRWEDYEGEIEV